MANKKKNVEILTPARMKKPKAINQKFAKTALEAVKLVAVPTPKIKTVKTAAKLGGKTVVKTVKQINKMRGK
jgi:hypothetical protein